MTGSPPSEPSMPRCTPIRLPRHWPEHVKSAVLHAIGLASVVARYSGHTWHIDLTTVPTRAGFWTPWFPFVLPQR